MTVDEFVSSLPDDMWPDPADGWCDEHQSWDCS